MARYESEYGLPQYDAEILTGSKHLADVFEQTVAICGKPKEVSNWLMTEAMRLLKEQEQEPENMKFSPKNLAKLISLVEKNVITVLLRRMCLRLCLRKMWIRKVTLRNTA